MGFGAAECGGVDVAVTETVGGFGPVAGEFAVDGPAEDFEELGSADVVESGVQTPGSVGLLIDGGGAELVVAFGFLGDTDLAAGEGVVPHPHRTAEFGFLDAAVGFGT